MLTFRFTGADGCMVQDETLTAGMIKKEVKLEFSSDWDNMTKTVVFSAGSVTRSVVGVSDVAVIPAEVLAIPLKHLSVGVYGVSSDGKVTPTIRVEGPVIKPGTDPSCDRGTDPDLAVWAQLQQEIEALKELGVDGEDGGYYIPAITQAEVNTMHISFAASAPTMPDVEPVTIELPVSDSSQVDYVIPVGGEELGGVKNGGNVVINADGTMTAPMVSTSGEELPDYVNQEIDLVVRKIRERFALLKNPIVVGMHTDQHTSLMSLSGTNGQAVLDVFHGMRALVKISKMIPFNVICLGGDAGSNSRVNAQGIVNFINGCFTDADCQVAHICGNHDTFHGVEFDTMSEIFSSHFKIWIKKGYIIQPEGYEGTCVGYYDDATCKVRFIYGDSNSHVDWSPQHNQAAITAMLTAIPEGYKAIIFTHHPTGVDAAFADKVICCINGHEHISDSSLGDDGNVHITTTTAGGTVRDELNRIQGTADGTACDIYVIDPVSNVAYVYRYGLGDDRIIDLTTGELITYYNVTIELVTATADVGNCTVQAGAGFSANITTTENTQAIIVTMGGVDITETAYADGVVTIESVTGNIVIKDTASGSEDGEDSAEFPEGYTPLAYIVNEGSAYIALPDVSEGNTSAIYKVNYSDWDTTQRHILSNYGGYNFPGLFLRSSGQHKLAASNMGAGTLTTTYFAAGTYATGIDYVIQAFGSSGEIYVDGEIVSTCAAGTNSGESPFAIGAKIDVSSSGTVTHTANGWHGRLYYLKMYESGVQTRNFIPAMDADGNVGLYDTIKGEFYDSDSDVAFTAPA